MFPGKKLITVPAGAPLDVSVIGFENPRLEMVPKIISIKEGEGHADTAGPGEVKLKSESGGATVKLVFEISKKILPTASTLIRALEVGIPGVMTISDPSLGVLAANTTGKV
jgi:hypothetical protein